MEDLIKRLVDREELNSRTIAVVTANGDAMRKDIDRALRELEDIRRCVHNIEVMGAKQTGVPVCGAPNLCLELRTHLEKLTVTVQELTELRAETRGGIRAAMAIASLFGTIGGAVLSYIIQHYIKHP